MRPGNAYGSCHRYLSNLQGNAFITEFIISLYILCFSHGNKSMEFLPFLSTCIIAFPDLVVDMCTLSVLTSYVLSISASIRPSEPFLPNDIHLYQP